MALFLLVTLRKNLKNKKVGGAQVRRGSMCSRRKGHIQRGFLVEKNIFPKFWGCVLIALFVSTFLITLIKRVGVLTHLYSFNKLLQGSHHRGGWEGGMAPYFLASRNISKEALFRGTKFKFDL